MNRFWACFFVAMPLLAIAVFIASARAWPPLAGTWFPISLSTQADQVDHLFLTIHLVAAVVLIITGSVLFLALFNSSERRPTKYIHGNLPLELTWTLIPAAILVFLAIYQSGVWTTQRITPPQLDPPLVTVVARQFDWEFFYTGPDGRWGTADDLRSVNELVVPKRDHVVLRLISEDVIHSFSVPQLRMKQDIVPGRETTVWFSPTGTGELEVLCAELCGWGHYNMRAKMRIVEEDEFQTWLDGLDRPEQGSLNLR